MFREAKDERAREVLRRWQMAGQHYDKRIQAFAFWAIKQVRTQKLMCGVRDDLEVLTPSPRLLNDPMTDSCHHDLHSSLSLQHVKGSRGAADTAWMHYCKQLAKAHLRQWKLAHVRAPVVSVPEFGVIPAVCCCFCGAVPRSQVNRCGLAGLPPHARRKQVMFVVAGSACGGEGRTIGRHSAARDPSG